MSESTEQEANLAIAQAFGRLICPWQQRNKLGRYPVQHSYTFFSKSICSGAGYAGK